MFFYYFYLNVFYIYAVCGGMSRDLSVIYNFATVLSSGNCDPKHSLELVTTSNKILAFGVCYLQVCLAFQHG